MEIKTKLDINQKCFFMVHNKVYSSNVVEIQTRTDNSKNTFENYTVKENPAGPQYTKTFNDSEVFATKEELLQTL